MSDSRKKMGVKLAGKHLLGFRPQTMEGEAPGSLRMSSAKIGEITLPPPLPPPLLPPPPPKTDSTHADKTSRARSKDSIDD